MTTLCKLFLNKTNFCQLIICLYLMVTSFDSYEKKAETRHIIMYLRYSYLQSSISINMILISATFENLCFTNFRQQRQTHTHIYIFVGQNIESTFSVLLCPLQKTETKMKNHSCHHSSQFEQLFSFTLKEHTRFLVFLNL